jgi:hypothetical protein
MENEKENKIECIGCNSYYLYYSRKKGDYVITDKVSEAFDNEPWIDLKDKHVSDLIKLLQEHEKILENNKANLSADSEYIQNIRKSIPPGQASSL